MGTPLLLLLLLLLTLLQIGDSLLFKRRDLRNLDLFHNRRASDLCNFADASSLIHHAESTHFKWTPVQPGRYFFSIKDESAERCGKGEKLLVRVIMEEQISPALSPEVAPPPTAGGDLPSSPSRGWWAAGGLTPPPSLSPEASPLEPSKGTASAAPPPEAGEGMPFISSNPAVPLPTGEANTAALRPLPNPTQGASQVVGQAVSLEIRMVLVAVTAIMSSALCFVLWI